MNDDRDRPNDDDLRSPGDERDRTFGDAIAALPVPSRDDAFAQDLLTRLEAADADQGAVATGRGAISRIVHPFFEWHAKGRRRWLLYAAAAAAAVILAVALFGPGGDTTSGPGTTTNPIAPIIGPEPATAAQVIRATLAATGTMHEMRCVVRAGYLKGRRFVEVGRFTYLARSDGSYAIPGYHLARAFRSGRLSGGAAAAVSFGWLNMVWDSRATVAMSTTYDAASRVAGTTWSFSRPMTFSRSETNGNTTVTTTTRALSACFLWQALPAGPPYNRYGDYMLPFFRLRAYLRQLVAMGASRLRSTIVDGRPCWLVSTTMASGAQTGSDGHVADRVAIVIDKATLVPLRFSRLVDGVVAQERYSQVAFEDDLPAATFRTVVPEGAWVGRAYGSYEGLGGPDDGFTALQLDDRAVLSQVIDVEPALPTWMPAGFVRTSVTAHSTVTEATGATESPRPAPDSALVSLAYRRGFDAVYVSAEPTDTSTGSMTTGGHTYALHAHDPYLQLYGPAWRYMRSKMRPVHLTRGPFAGQTAYIVVDPSLLPHLWVRGPGFTVTVGGDLSATDMVRVVESLATGLQVLEGKATVR